MIPLLTVLTIGIVAWRYRKVFGFDKTWDRYGRAQADELAERLGWRARTSSRAVPSRPSRPAQPKVAPTTSLLPRVDSRRLPAALAAGALEAVVIVGLELQGYSFLASLVSLLAGPFIGGVYVRSRWWMLVAAMIAVIVGAGGTLGPIVVALSVAAIAYAGHRADLRAWIARLSTLPGDPND